MRASLRPQGLISNSSPLLLDIPLRTFPPYSGLLREQGYNEKKEWPSFYPGLHDVSVQR